MKSSFQFFTFQANFIRNHLLTVVANKSNVDFIEA